MIECESKHLYENDRIKKLSFNIKEPNANTDLYNKHRHSFAQELNSSNVTQPYTFRPCEYDSQNRDLLSTARKPNLGLEEDYARFENLQNNFPNFQKKAYYVEENVRPAHKSCINLECECDAASNTASCKQTKQQRYAIAAPKFTRQISAQNTRCSEAKPVDSKRCFKGKTVNKGTRPVPLPNQPTQAPSELKKLVKENMALQNEIKYLNEKLQELNEGRSTLKEELSSQILSQHEAKVRQLREGFENQMEREKRIAEKKIDSGHTVLSQLEAELRNVKETLGVVTNKWKEEEQLTSELRKTNSLLEKESAAALQTVARYSEKNIALTTVFEETVNRLNDKKARIETLENALQQMKGDIEAAKDIYYSQQKEYNKMSQELLQKQEEIKRCREAMELCDNKIKSCQHSIKILKENLDQVRKNKKMYALETEMLKDINGSLKSQCAVLLKRATEAFQIAQRCTNECQYLQQENKLLQKRLEQQKESLLYYMRIATNYSPKLPAEHLPQTIKKNNNLLDTINHSFNPEINTQSNQGFLEHFSQDEKQEIPNFLENASLHSIPRLSAPDRDAPQSEAPRPRRSQIQPDYFPKEQRKFTPLYRSNSASYSTRNHSVTSSTHSKNFSPTPALKRSDQEPNQTQDKQTTNGLPFYHRSPSPLTESYRFNKQTNNHLKNSSNKQMAKVTELSDKLLSDLSQHNDYNEKNEFFNAESQCDSLTQKETSQNAETEKDMEKMQEFYTDQKDCFNYDASFAKYLESQKLVNNQVLNKEKVNAFSQCSNSENVHQQLNADLYSQSNRSYGSQLSRQPQSRSNSRNAQAELEQFQSSEDYANLYCPMEKNYNLASEKTRLPSSINTYRSGSSNMKNMPSNEDNMCKISMLKCSLDSLKNMNKLENLDIPSHQLSDLMVTNNKTPELSSKDNFSLYNRYTYNEQNYSKPTKNKEHSNLETESTEILSSSQSHDYMFENNQITDSLRKSVQCI